MIKPNVPPWLCHSDARQVFDLPDCLQIPSRSPTASPAGHGPAKGAGFFVKAKTCRASERQSRETGRPTGPNRIRA
jgi:hypothetical protein